MNRIDPKETPNWHQVGNNCYLGPEVPENLQPNRNNILEDSPITRSPV